MKMRILAVSALLLVAGAASASVTDPVVNHRQAAQHERIGEGVASGELTRHEATRLRAEQRAIRAEEHAFKRDGVLTVAERRKLNHDLNAASRHIHNEKHDAQVR